MKRVKATWNVFAATRLTLGITGGFDFERGSSATYFITLRGMEPHMQKLRMCRIMLNDITINYHKCFFNVQKIYEWQQSKLWLKFHCIWGGSQKLLSWYLHLFECPAARKGSTGSKAKVLSKTKALLDLFYLCTRKQWCRDVFCACYRTWISILTIVDGRIARELQRPLGN